jgi:hypothetical protein
MLRNVGVALALALGLWVENAGAQPKIFWFNDPVGPDETVLVTGADLETVTAVTIGRISDSGSATVPIAEQAIAPLQANPLSLKFVIPKEFTSGIYRFTLSSPEGSVSARANLPTVYWTQSNLGVAASSGGWIQLLGRNIVRRGDHAQLLLLREGADAPLLATLVEGSLWRGIFRVPEQIPPATYHLRLSNGEGGNEESVDAGSIVVRPPDAEPQQVFDVRAYGAVGNGITNSTRAIAAAMDAASRNGGGTVYLPHGRYLVSETIAIPPHVRLKGERTDLVNLVWPDLSDPPDALIKGASDFSIEDLTIYASNHRHILSGGFMEGDPQAPRASNIAIRRVRIRASAFLGLMDPEATFKRMTEIQRRFPNSSGPDSIRLSGDNIEVTDCDIVGSGRSLYLFKASNAVISGNILNNGRYGWYSITGSKRVIFESNVISAVDLQGTGGGINTLSESISASENILITRNTFKGIYAWDREALTTDGPAGYYFGRAKTSAPDRITLIDGAGVSARSNWIGAVAMVVNGRGAGQFARVAAPEKMSASSERSITLDRALQVDLDATSVITITQMQQNYLIIDNQFEDAGVAAQTFGIALNHVFAENRSVRTGGFYAIGLYYDHFQPSWQVQILDNRILEGNVYRAHREALSEEAAIGVRANQTATKAGAPPLVRAVIVRGNRLEQDAHVEVLGFSAASPGVRDVVVENNEIGPSGAGLTVDRGVAWLLNRRNVINQRIGK